MTLGLTALLYVVIPKGLFPTQDTGQLQARVEASQDVSYARMSELQQAAVRAILQDPDVLSLSSFVGVDAANNTMLNAGRMLINLKPDRDGQEAIMQRLRERVRSVAGVTLYLQPTQDLTIDAETGPPEYRVSIGGVDAAQVNDWTRKLAERLQREPKVRNATTDAGAQGLSAFVDIDRNTASRLSVTASSVDDTLYSAFGQRIVSTIFTETNQYRVILEAQQEGMNTPEALGTLQLRTGSGTPTPLAAVATIRRGGGAVGAHGVGQRPGGDRHHRHHPADLHRQEERDHDDRLRHRRRAPPGHGAAAGHPPGRAAALSPHSHDHAGGAVCRAAADAGLGRGGGTAPAPGAGDFWRPDPEPDAHPFHHAGDLSGV